MTGPRLFSRVELFVFPLTAYPTAPIRQGLYPGISVLFPLFLAGQVCYNRHGPFVIPIWMRFGRVPENAADVFPGMWDKERGPFVIPIWTRFGRVRENAAGVFPGMWKKGT